MSIICEDSRMALNLTGLLHGKPGALLAIDIRFRFRTEMIEAVFNKREDRALQAVRTLLRDCP